MKILLAVVFLSIAQAQVPKTIVFVGGPKDHGAPDRHEYLKDLKVLKYCIDRSPAGKDLKTLVFNGKVPDLKRFTNVAAIVLESSGDRIGQETHALFPQDATTDGKTYDPYTLEQLKQFDALMKGGTGLVAIHYTTWINNPTGRKYFADWLGGYYEDGYSKVVKDNWAVEPANDDHPILRGVHAWSYSEEFFTKERLPDDPRRTTLLTGKSETGVSSVLSWAVERSGGGRGFVMTGSDFHKNLSNEQHLRLLLNGVAWAAKLDVPPAGMTCELGNELP
jgi:type 1 glutamine amidotransferase